MYTLDDLNDYAFSASLARYAVDMVVESGMLLEDTSHDCFSFVAGGECSRELLHGAGEQALL